MVFRTCTIGYRSLRRRNFFLQDSFSGKYNLAAKKYSDLTLLFSLTSGAAVWGTFILLTIVVMMGFHETSFDTYDLYLDHAQNPVVLYLVEEKGGKDLAVANP